MSPRPKGRLAKSDLKERIIQAAWHQIAREGAPALSLRAIARALGIAAPSIYNYFADRDELVTTLILEAYASFGDRQMEAFESVSPQDSRAKLYAIGLAYRNWAVEYPERYHLIFGTPIPGYAAPRERISQVATRSLTALQNVVEEFARSGQMKEAALSLAESELAEIAVLIWTRVHGLVSVIISNNLPPICNDGDKLFQHEMDLILDQFFEIDNERKNDH